MIEKLKFALTEIKSSNSLSARAMRSGIWIACGFFIQRSLQLGSNLILTRLLFPEAFGLMALATIFLVGLSMLSDIGLKSAIIRDLRSDDPAFLNTAWTLQVMRGVGLFIAGGLLAYPISLLYGEPILFPLLTTLSATAAISGFQTIGLATAERKFDFRRPTAIAILGQAIGILVLISLAFYLRTVWALAVGNVIGSLATVAVGHLLIKGHSHRIRLEPESMRSLIKFGKWILASTMTSFLGGEGIKAVQAGFLTSAEFGVLSISYMLAGAPTDLMVRVSSSIFPPMLSELNRNENKLKFNLSKARSRLIIASGCIAFPFLLILDFLISFLYDDRYHDAASYGKIIVVGNWISFVFLAYSIALISIGNVKDHLFSSGFLSILRIVSVFFGLKTGGIFGSLVAIAVANLLHGVYLMYFAHKMRILDLKVDLLSTLFVIPLLIVGDLVPWKQYVMAW